MKMMNGSRGSKSMLCGILLKSSVLVTFVGICGRSNTFMFGNSKQIHLRLLLGFVEDLIPLCLGTLSKFICSGKLLGKLKI
jgi:hypothetical protein